METRTSSLKIADIIPKAQLRGAEIFAHHLQEALAAGSDCRMFTLEPGKETLRSDIEAFAPDVVMTHGGDPLRAAVRAGLHELAPVAYLKISSVPARARRGLRARALRRAYQHVTAFVSVSESLKHELVEAFGIPEDRIEVIPNGRPRVELIHGERQALRSELGCSDDDVLVMWVGSLVPEKDPEALLRLARELATAAPSVRVAMIGDGPMMPSLHPRASELPNLRMTGGRSDASRCIAASDVLISTSVTEGIPGVIIEALLAGVPVIAPAIGGIPEVVGEGGFLTTPGDEHQMTARIAALADSSPHARAQLSEAAARAGEPFEIGKIASRFADLYRRIATA